MKKESSHKTNLGARPGFIFGGNGGGFSPISGTGDQWVIFKTGFVMDSIQIGDKVYGGSGGGVGGRAQLPANGVFTLYKIAARENVLCFIDCDIDGTRITAGNTDWWYFAAFPNGISVKFVGINSGSSVDSVTLEIVE